MRNMTFKIIRPIDIKLFQDEENIFYFDMRYLVKDENKQYILHIPKVAISNINANEISLTIFNSFGTERCHVAFDSDMEFLLDVEKMDEKYFTIERTVE